MGLPALEAMLPGKPLLRAAESVSKPPVRLAWVFFPNGTNPREWEPTKEGADWDIKPSLEALTPFKQDFSMLSGLAQVNARSLGDGPGDHARSAAAFLTGAHPIKTAGATCAWARAPTNSPLNNTAATRVYLRSNWVPSVDEVRVHAIVAMPVPTRITFLGALLSQPMAKEIHPRLAFQRLFGNGASGASAEGKQLLFQRSILDMVADDARNCVSL